MGEFNVDKTTGSLEQTAGMPSEYPASQVMLSDGVTSVGDVIEANTFGTGVNIKPYNTTLNQYTCSSDGYLYLYSVNSGSRLQATINTTIPITAIYNSGIGATSIFLKKGMKIRCDSAGQSTDLIEFYPLT